MYEEHILVFATFLQLQRSGVDAVDMIVT